MPRVLSLSQILAKRYKFLELPDEIKASFGEITSPFRMIIYGDSANGKTNFTIDFTKALMPNGRVLYVSLEEGFEATTQLTVIRHLNKAEHSGRIQFADHEMGYDALVERLKKKRSPKFIIIDSIQYWNINYEQYKELKRLFPRKCFIFLSHVSGKTPDGKVAEKIRYDTGLKVRVEGFVAFPRSRYGGNTPYVIHEDSAKSYWGKKYHSTVRRKMKVA